MTYRIVWQCLIIAVLGLSTTACLQQAEDDTVDANVDANGNDATPEPAVSITSPDAAQIDTVDTTIDVAGTASAGIAIESISWENDLGGSGTASGTESWQANDIPLELGDNTITVSATTVDGKSSSDRLVVHRESENKGSATMSWNAPTQTTAGTPLTNLAGFRIYYGRMSGVYDYQVEIVNPGVATYVVEDLVPGDWYFVATAYDASGNESDYSNEVVKAIL